MVLTRFLEVVPSLHFPGRMIDLIQGSPSCGLLLRPDHVLEFKAAYSDHEYSIQRGSLLSHFSENVRGHPIAHSQEKASTVAQSYNPDGGETETGGSLGPTVQPSNLAKSASSSSMRDPVSRNKRKWKRGWCWPLPPHTHMHNQKINKNESHRFILICERNQTEKNTGWVSPVIVYDTDIHNQAKLSCAVRSQNEGGWEVPGRGQGGGHLRSLEHSVSKSGLFIEMYSPSGIHQAECLWHVFYNCRTHLP